MSIRRILVALDASRHSMAALEAAVEMASQMDAEILGVFVEDINLLRLANFPFAREVGHQTATGRHIDVTAMERALKRLAAESERAIATTAERRHVAWSFRVVRGPVVAELIAAARGVDLLMIGRCSQISARQRLGSTALAMLTGASSAILLLEQEVCFGAPVLALYDGSETAGRGLSAAVNLARVRQDQLMILILADSPQEALRLEAEALHVLEEEEIEPQFHSLFRTDLDTLVHTVKSLRPGVVVIDGATDSFEQEDFQKLVAALDCPVYVVK